MDRTIIAPRRAEEKELSEKLCQKLQGLTILYAPTEEFRKCISKEMFLKPNQHAFFHTMHFLFRLLDPNDFKKRFYWPITDKRGEANFRTSTVDYLKHLNEKHQLQWTNIKSYLVVMPGGMKFIVFMLEFVGFVVQELTRQREKHLSNDVEAGQITELNLKRMRRQNEFFKEYASAYISEVDGQNAKLREKTILVRKQLEIMSRSAGLDIAQITDESFLTEFQSSCRKLFQQKFPKCSANIMSLEKPLVDLKYALEKFQTKEAEVKYDKNAVLQSLRRINEIFPKQIGKQHDSFIRPYCRGGGDVVQMNALIAAFNGIFATVEDSLDAVDQKYTPNEFVATELSSLMAEYQQIESQVNDFQKMLNISLKRRKQQDAHTPLRGRAAVCDSNTGESGLMMKFVCTPPIKLDPHVGAGRNMRLPLLDDFSAKSMDALHSFHALSRSSARKTNRSHTEHSLDLNNTTIKSRIIDPLQLLRTINKVKPVTQQHNLSALGSKWKQRQCLFGNDIESGHTVATTPKKTLNTVGGAAVNVSSAEQVESHSTSTAVNATLVQSPFTPFNSNERTRITLTGGSGGGSSTLLYTKKLSAVKKVQDASLNLHNLSTSPSGRLDTLMSIDAPKLMVNDITLMSPAGAARVVTKACLPTTELFPLSDFAESYENNPNIANVVHAESKKFSPDLNEDEEALFNISDGVLQDVTM